MLFIPNHTATEYFKGISRHRASLMGLSIISVMLFHQYFISAPPFNIFHNYGYWGVEVFLFLSGKGMVSSLKNHTLTEFYKRRVLRILPICIVCGTLKYSVFLMMGASLAPLQEGLHLGWWSVACLDLWYVNVLLIFYAASPFLYRSLGRYPLQTLFLILVIFCLNGLTLRPQVGYEWMSPVGLSSWAIERLPVFALGMFVAMRKEIVNRRNIVFSALFFFIAVLLVMLIKMFNLNAVAIVVRVFSLALGMLSLVFVSMQALNRTPTMACKFTTFMGRHSLEIYLVHEFVFATFMLLFNKHFLLS